MSREIEPVETVEVVKVFERKVWIESDMLGSKHVMLQHDDGESEPFTYCTFHYGYGYTSNGSIWAVAEAMALSLGAKQPVEVRHREFNPELLGGES